MAKKQDNPESAPAKKQNRLILKKKQRNKIATVLREFKEGELNVGKSKKKVRNKKQALAIGLSMARKIAPISKKINTKRK